MFNALYATELSSFVRKGDAPYKQSITLRDSVTPFPDNITIFLLFEISYIRRHVERKVCSAKGWLKTGGAITRLIHIVEREIYLGVI